MLKQLIGSTQASVLIALGAMATDAPAHAAQPEGHCAPVNAAVIAIAAGAQQPASPKGASEASASVDVSRPQQQTADDYAPPARQVYFGH